jgi:hypothetical protein
VCNGPVLAPFLDPLLALIFEDAPNPLVTHFKRDQDQSLNDFPFLSATLPVAQSRLINFERSLVKCRPFFVSGGQVPLLLKSLVGKRIIQQFVIECNTVYSLCLRELAKNEATVSESCYPPCFITYSVK